MSEQSGEGWEVPSVVRDQVYFHWFHVVPRSALVLCLTSMRPLWFVGHFHKKRMLRCRGQDCHWCRLSVGKQVRYVFGGVDLQTRREGVIEVSESVAQLVREWAVPNGGARGLIVEFEKSTGSKHSRMDVRLIREHPPGWALACQEPDLGMILRRTWEKIESSLGEEMLAPVG